MYYKCCLVNVDVCVCVLAQGINFLFPVQTSTYDHIYEGHDVIVQASKHRIFILISNRTVLLLLLLFISFHFILSLLSFMLS